MLYCRQSVVPVIGRDCMLSNASTSRFCPSTRIQSPAEPMMSADFTSAANRRRFPA
jgi:hypothetical protein